jgi:outer membrane lipoprotein-sorting protein
MKFLRHISTRRLLALCAAFVAAVGGGTAIAIAATSGGPTPPPKPLADAIHAALAAPKVDGVTARIHFTNHLIDKSSLGEGADPLLMGASGRLWASKDGRARLELQSDGGGGDTQALLEGDNFTIYDATQNTVYRGTLPANKDKSSGSAGSADHVPSVADIQRKLTDLMGRVNLSGATPSSVAGHAAYTVRMTPKHDGGLLGGAELAWDAATGVPLRAAVYAAGDSNPVLELAATDISFGAVDGSVFNINVPAGAKVVDLAPHTGGAGDPGGAAKDKPVEGAGPVQAKLPFKLTAPDTLVGLPRAGVRLISSDKSPAALVTYGRGLGGIAVIESKAQPQAGRGGLLGDLQLTKVSIGGVTGRELDTALATVIMFTRDGVDYVVLGSVPPAAAEAAARAL